MKRLDFRTYAADLARDQSRQAMAPVIEKEIVHYEILNALDEKGVLAHLSFQGGTCLRLCYGGVRYSEDLDFAAGKAFDSLEPDLLGATLKSALERRFDVEVRVKSPRKDRDFSGVGVKRWWAIVDTAPARPDLPSQRIKVEIADVPSHTNEIRRVELHYPQLPSSYASILARCQTLPEILADKVIAFSHSAEYTRYRDLWDIPWIMQQPGVELSALPLLVSLKHHDYHCETPLAEMLADGLERAEECIRSETFRQEMERFIPADVIARTIGRATYAELMAADLKAAFESALPAPEPL